MSECLTALWCVPNRYEENKPLGNNTLVDMAPCSLYNLHSCVCLACQHHPGAARVQQRYTYSRNRFKSLLTFLARPLASSCVTFEVKEVPSRMSPPTCTTLAGSLDNPRPRRLFAREACLRLGSMTLAVNNEECVTERQGAGSARV